MPVPWRGNGWFGENGRALPVAVLVPEPLLLLLLLKRHQKRFGSIASSGMEKLS
jgi:hypothetical protein